MMLIRILVFLTSLGIGAMSGAGTEDNDRFNRHFVENTSRVLASESPYGEALINRRLVKYVQMGKTFELPKSDIEIINSAGEATGVVEAMKPMMDQLELKVSVKGSSAVEMAQIWQDAVLAERAIIAGFYSELIGRLSAEGQKLLAVERAGQIKRMKFSEVDFVTLATQDPDGVLVLMTQAAEDYKSLAQRSVESKAPSVIPPAGKQGQVYGIQEKQGDDNVSD